MAAPTRPPMPGKKISTMVPTMRPSTNRPAPNRAQTATPTMNGRASPTDSVVSSKSRAPKRKTLESEDASEETNINVVVRCRGRNDREVRENSGVVVWTDGVKGKKVELSMGPSALSNKTYSFDKVFSPAADQDMIFDDVVAPILDEVLAGFNCTVFAYGQTGTGKTYTMSGDITDSLPLSDAAGIIPRVLYSLFDKLGDEQEGETSVKCSFIELYNEELRDLLSADDSTKLKIFDDASKKGSTATLVQGMEERHIKNASKGIQLLREGSHKRQVAATKCNDLSSRSHTVFTVTVYMKRTSDTGEDFVSAGKLNLVDLAGSENIQRSGAENKRAAEAGLINKSLLTLGRVINALVEKGSHIPYRESKLTRLLQDSLGGRTKTCIIATLSPAKSNLEETISTLDYAFRAKNIRNKPQVNQMVSKRTLLKDFTTEIEKLKSELIATRQRNGVYLTQESYEEITTESESRRILSEEQRDRIETMEANLRNRVQELFSLTSNFNLLKKDNEATRMQLDGTKSVLGKTEIVLAHTRNSLAQETELRKAHQETEAKLTAAGEDLLSTLDTTTDHVGRLHEKHRRRSDLHAANRSRWADSRGRVAETTSTVEGRLDVLKSRQEGLISALAGRMQSFVQCELRELQSSQSFLQQKASAFEHSHIEVNAQTSKSKDDMNRVLEEIRTLREDVKQKVGAGLNDLSAAAQRISAGIATELDAFHAQLQDSYVCLGKEFKATFEELNKGMREQQVEAERLRQQITVANDGFVEDRQASQMQLEEAVAEERKIAVEQRQQLFSQIASLIDTSAVAQEARLARHVETSNKRLRTSRDEYMERQTAYSSGMDSWNTTAYGLVDSCVRSRDSIKAKLKTDWATANEHTHSITRTTNAVHDETVRIVDGQMAQMDHQLVALDEIVSRVKAQNDEHHQAHTKSLEMLAGNVQESYQSIGGHFETSYRRTESLDQEMRDRATALHATLPELAYESQIREPLRTLREQAATEQLAEYTPTGETPAKMQYSYPTTLPRTQPPNQDAPPSPLKSPSKPTRSPSKPPPSPSKQQIYTDTPPSPSLLPQHPSSAPPFHPLTSSSVTSLPTTLREVDVNIPAAPAGLLTQSVAAGNEAAAARESKVPAPPLKRLKTDCALPPAQVEGKLPMKRGGRLAVAGVAEGRENLMLGGGGGLGGCVGPGGGRRLRNRGSD